MTRQIDRATSTLFAARADLREARLYLSHGAATPRYLKKVAARAARRASRLALREAV